MDDKIYFIVGLNNLRKILSLVNITQTSREVLKTMSQNTGLTLALEFTQNFYCFIFVEIMEEYER